VMPTHAQDKEDFKIVGYYSLKAAMENKTAWQLKHVTHINLWFLNPDSLGRFEDLSAISKFVKSAHKKDVKVLFSIGGGSKQKQYHRLLQDDQRSSLVAGLVEQVLKYNVDGIDVDLEGSDIDNNYEKFVTELGQALRTEGKLLTSAIAVYYKDQLTDAALTQFDFVNVMSYDRTGPWRPEKPGPHATYDHAVEDITYFADTRRIPREKMTLGVPFYGYGFGPDINSEAISMSYVDIVKMFDGAEDQDQWTMPDKKILYYNGEETIRRKTLLAKEKASGIMIWQIRGDSKGKRSLLKLINKTAKEE